MITEPSSLIEHMASSATTLCTVWEIERTDGKVLHYTDADVNVEVDGVLYLKSGGYNASAVSYNSTLSVDNLEVVGFLSSDTLLESELISGVFDGATVKIGEANWKEPSQGILWKKQGKFGVVSMSDGVFKVELRGITQFLQQQIGTVLTPMCSAAFGDSKCKVNTSSYKSTGTITNTSGKVLQDSSRVEASGFWNYGTIKMTSGANTGRTMEVESSNGQNIVLMFKFPYPVVAGDTYEIVKGCAKTLDACKGYSNVINFRGFPKVPGSNAILQGA